MKDEIIPGELDRHTPTIGSGSQLTNDFLLSVRNLSCAYVSRRWGLFGKKEVKPVLDHVNLDIRRGEIFGLVGESGCGKTTLGKCILGVMDYSGEIFINGRKRVPRPSFRERREAAFEVQAVFQDSGASLNPAKSIGWIMEEPLRAHGLGSAAERQRRVDETLDTVGLDASIKRRKAAELSSGQKQRVAIGAALILNPGLIVADEPVSALDASVTAQILNLFRGLNKKLGISFLFISHNIELVRYLCDQTAVMRKGKLK